MVKEIIFYTLIRKLEYDATGTKKVFDKKDGRYLSFTESGAHWPTGKYQGSGTV